MQSAAGSEGTRPASFAYRHEPYQRGDNDLRWLDTGTLRLELAQRIRHSRGGAFLLCGFRGVGKTSLVNRVLDDLESRDTAERRVTIKLSVAKPVTPLELLSTLARCLAEELSRNMILERLPLDLQDRIWLCSARTSAAVGLTRSDSAEITRSAAVDLGFKTKGSSLGWRVGNASKRSMAQGSSLAFSSYSEWDAEYDFISIINDLSKTRLKARRWWRRLLRRMEPPVSVLVVFDELDKLTSSPEGPKALRNLLASLKTVLSTAGIHIVCIGGVELIDEARLDSSRGNGIYESVFSWIEYVPCSWNRAADYLHASDLSLPAPMQELPLTLALDFESRGSLRRLVQGIHRLVVWDTHGDPIIELNHERVEFHAELNSLVEKFVQAWSPAGLQSLMVDRLRLGAYLVCDWVMATEGAVFSGTQLIEGPSALSASIGMSRARVERFLMHLAHAGVLDLAWEPRPDQTVIDGVAVEPRFVLSKSTRNKLTALSLAAPDALAQSSEAAPPPRGAWGSAPGRPASPWPWGAPGPVREVKIVGQDYSGAQEEATTLWKRSAELGLGDATRGWGVAPSPGGIGQDPPIDQMSGDLSRTMQPRVTLLHPGSVLEDRWRLGEVIAAGAHGSVYAATDDLGLEDVVVKVVDGFSRIWDAREWFASGGVGQKLLNLRSPHVVRYLAAFQVGDSIALVLERLGGAPLRRWLHGESLHRIPVEAISREILLGLSDLHRIGLCNVDLKPDNVMLSDVTGPAVLIDVELASTEAIFGESVPEQRLAGTLVYVAPEVFNGKGFSASADIYSFGVLLSEVLLLKRGRPMPLPAQGCTEILALVAETEKVQVVEFLGRCLREDPKLRFQTASEALGSLPAL